MRTEYLVCYQYWTLHRTTIRWWAIFNWLVWRAYAWDTRKLAPLDITLEAYQDGRWLGTIAGRERL